MDKTVTTVLDQSTPNLDQCYKLFMRKFFWTKPLFSPDEVTSINRILNLILLSSVYMLWLSSWVEIVTNVSLTICRPQYYNLRTNVHCPTGYFSGEALDRLLIHVSFILLKQKTANFCCSFYCQCSKE